MLEGSSGDMITQLSNGCLCCTVRDDLIQALNRLWHRRKDFDHVVIETTGLANPAPIISSFFMDADLPDRCVDEWLAYQPFGPWVYSPHSRECQV